MQNLIPIIDLSAATKNNQYNEIAFGIEKAIKNNGFFYVKNHGIDNYLIKDLFDLSKKFFDLPLESKMFLDSRKSIARRGYFPIYAENTNPSQNIDFKEGFDVMANHKDTDLRVVNKIPFFGKNIWPKTIKNFENISMQYYNRLIILAFDIMKTISHILSLPENFFLGEISDPFAMLRILKYPKQKSHDKLMVGAGTHTDYGLITILAQNEIKGLEVQDKKGNWLEVEPIKDLLLVNFGDEMAMWTNNIIQATPHRVINKSDDERYSSVFFFHSPYDKLITPQPQFITADKPQLYKPIKSIDYMTKRFSETFENI